MRFLILFRSADTRQQTSVIFSDAGCSREQASAQLNDFFRKLFNEGVHLLFLLGGLEFELLQPLPQPPVLLREPAHCRCLGATVLQEISRIPHGWLQHHRTVVKISALKRSRAARLTDGAGATALVHCSCAELRGGGGTLRRTGDRTVTVRGGERRISSSVSATVPSIQTGDEHEFWRTQPRTVQAQSAPQELPTDEV